MSSKYENSGFTNAPGSDLGDLFGAAVSTIEETINSGAAALVSAPHRANGNKNGAYALGVKKSLSPAFDCFRQSGPALADNDNNAVPAPYWKRDHALGAHFC